MIIRHKIIVENNEEILVVYLDNSIEEFASELGDNAEVREKNLLEQISDYIKNKNIKFGGNIVKVLVGAIVVATLAMAPGGNITTKAATTTDTARQSYVVEPGDNLSTIAYTYGITVDDLKEMNNLTSDIIHPGQTLILRRNAEVGVYNVQPGDSLWTIANKYKMTVEELKELNKTGDTIYPGQKLKVIQAESPKTHTVKAGDSLWDLARAYNTTVENIKKANNLTSDLIRPGDTLRIPTDAATPTGTTYTVKAGDNLWNLARAFDTTVERIKSENNLTSDLIHPGDTLRITRGATAETEVRKTYTVKAGDSLWDIARMYGTTVAGLKSANNLTTDTIRPGQTLVIPSATTRPTTPVKTSMSINIRRSSGVVQNISLEEYVTGVVAAELGAGFNEASYKAQALAARTYAVRRINEGKTITDTDSHQVYLDRNQIRQSWGEHDFNIYYPMVEKAVNETRGEVIMYDGEYIEALFFSTSNGKTEQPEFVWGGKLDYLKSVDSHWDTRSPYFYRVSTFTYSEFAARLGISSANLYANVLTRTANGSVNTINISGRTFTGNYVKSRLGLRSTDFDIKFAGGKVTIEQRGWGHSVGLSQYGAFFMGEEGYTYDQIIHHYYRGVDIVTL